MADPAERVSENVPGRFYVDRTCIDCELCRETAPANFARQDEQGYSYVVHQPTDETEAEACLAAMEECPVEAIGCDDEPGARQPQLGISERQASPAHIPDEP